MPDTIAFLERALELAREPSSCGVLDVNLRDGLVFPAAQALRDKGAGIVELRLPSPILLATFVWGKTRISSM